MSMGTAMGLTRPQSVFYARANYMNKEHDRGRVERSAKRRFRGVEKVVDE
jgi:hypothetical protein